MKLVTLVSCEKNMDFLNSGVLYLRVTNGGFIEKRSYEQLYLANIHLFQRKHIFSDQKS